MDSLLLLVTQRVACGLNMQTGNNLNANNSNNHHAEQEVQIAKLEAEDDAVETDTNILDQNATENEQEVPEEETTANLRPQRTRRPADRSHLCVVLHMRIIRKCSFLLK